MEDPGKGNVNAKKYLPTAAVVAREGLKADNISRDVIRDAVLHYREIIASKDALTKESPLDPIPTKRKLPALSREGLGMAMRRWGPHWRSTVISSMVAEAMRIEQDSGTFLRPLGLLRHTDEYGQAAAS